MKEFECAEVVKVEVDVQSSSDEVKAAPGVEDEA